MFTRNPSHLKEYKPGTLYRGREPGGAGGLEPPPLFDKGGLSPPKIGGCYKECIKY